jgi:hypothetical protein
MVNQYLDAITAQTHVEALDYVADTRRELDLSVRIAQVEVQPSTTPMVPSSTDPKRVYLPLIKR